MKKNKTSIPGLFIIEENSIFEDDRGLFFESWSEKKLNNLKLKTTFKQDNISISNKNVLRGLHIQTSPKSQLKLVQVLKGKVMDVVIDLRKKSPSFGKYEKILLDSNERKMIWIPEGCAHGFLSLQDKTIFSYKCNKSYNPNYEITLNWNDPDLNINWEIKKPILSKKDKKGISLKDFLKLQQQ
tara:strand:+ start:192 stop:743 length:552 start_codon:yes stop_codon:yes gene_type:complete